LASATGLTACKIFIGSPAFNQSIFSKVIAGNSPSIATANSQIENPTPVWDQWLATGLPWAT